MPECQGTPCSKSFFPCAKLECNWTWTHNHLVHKRTLNHLANGSKYGNQFQGPTKTKSFNFFYQSLMTFLKWSHWLKLRELNFHRFFYFKPTSSNMKIILSQQVQIWKLGPAKKAQNFNFVLSKVLLTIKHFKPKFNPF